MTNDQEVNIEKESKQKQIQKSVELELVKERQEQFKQLETDIVDLNSIRHSKCSFNAQDLSTQDQGETILNCELSNVLFFW